MGAIPNPNPDLNPNPNQADDFEPAFAALLPPEHYAVHAAQQRREVAPVKDAVGGRCHSREREQRREEVYQ